LTRGGLSPEAVDKAAKAYEAGDVHALSLTYYKVLGRDEKHLICPIPEELLTRVFPELVKATPRDVEIYYLEYEINRHRGGVQSITIRYPNSEENVEPPEPEKSPPPTVDATATGFRELPERKEAPANTETGAPPDDDWMADRDEEGNAIDEIG